jgi:hypothetical protein
MPYFCSQRLASCAVKTPGDENGGQVAAVFVSELLSAHSYDRHGGFAGRIEEGSGHYFGGDGFAFGFDGYFHVESGAQGGVFAVDAG